MPAIVALLIPAIFLRPDLPAAVAAGDDAFSHIDYPAAVATYETALRADHSDPELLWRLARVYVCMAETQPADSQQALLDRAAGYARDCIRIAPHKAEGHTWLAGALGYLALRAGAKEQIRLSRELVRETDTAIAIDPDDDAAYSIQGSFYRALGNVGWLRKGLASVFLGSVPDGGFEDAERALKKAVSIAPDVMRHAYELGILYIDMGKKDDAVEWLERASKLPVRVGIDRPRLQKIRDLLAELRTELHPSTTIRSQK